MLSRKVDAGAENRYLPPSRQFNLGLAGQSRAQAAPKAEASRKIRIGQTAMPKQTSKSASAYGRTRIARHRPTAGKVSNPRTIASATSACNDQFGRGNAEQGDSQCLCERCRGLAAVEV